MIVVTGGAGFIGSNFIIDWLFRNDEKVVNIDKLSYASSLDHLKILDKDERYIFVKGDINDIELLETVFNKFKPRAIVHFAAESHVDRSITGPEVFVQSNIIGTYNLLNQSLNYWKQLSLKNEKTNFRFIHVSTDEVYGTLDNDEELFTETSPYKPNSPYSASKASSDHLVRAWHHTYNLPVITTNCSNNYGPHQHFEKLIPLIIKNAITEKNLPIYGDGLHVRDWLYVKDHCSGIMSVLDAGNVGETYNIGGWNEKSNIEVVKIICNILDDLYPRSGNRKYSELITFVTDRPGHDRRYAIDSTKIEKDLGWRPKETFESGIEKTIKWYLDYYKKQNK